MPSIELVREVETYRQTMTIDTFEWSGSSAVPAGWKVRVSGYDGKSPMPAFFDLLPGGRNEKDTTPAYEATLAKYRAEGWSEELTPAARARIDARRARQQAEEDAREADLARRLAAFPASALDRVLADAIAKPAAVRELDLRARGDDRLTVLPKTVKKLAALEVLRLDGNGLPELPEELSACKELRELHLANNALVEVPTPVRMQKHLAVFDLRNNRLRKMNMRAKVPMRLELAGNPLGPAVQDLLTRCTIGDFRKISHFSVDTDCLFPIDLSYYEVDFPGVKALPTASIVLCGRPPTDDERATLAKLFPKAKVEHHATVRFDDVAPATTAPARKPVKTASRASSAPHADQAAHLESLLADAKKLKLTAADVKRYARPCVELFTKAPSKAASKVGASRLGGAPDLPAKAKWPKGAAGPMMFVGQLDCAALAPFDPQGLLPEAGLLAFFAGNYDEGAVLFFGPKEKLAPRALPARAKFGAEVVVVAPACAFTLRGGISLPNYEEVEDLDTRQWHELWELSIRETRNVAPHRVLGHTAADVEQPPEGDLALFAVRSDDHAKMMWGDGGTLYFMLNEQSLRARRWEDVEVVSTD